MAASKTPQRDLVDQVIDALEQDDVDAARQMVKARLAEEPTDEDALAALDLIEAPDAELEEEPVDALAFLCVGCGHAVDNVHTFMLNTRGLTFLGLDVLNREATCYLCGACGLVHWFLPGTPAVYQAMHPRRSTTQAHTRKPTMGAGCSVCGFDQGWTHQALVNTGGLSFLGLDFLNRAVGMLVCGRCGHLHWHATGGDRWVMPGESRGPPQPMPRGRVAAVRERCLYCKSASVVVSRGLLNTRALTRFGLDWLDPNAEVVECGDCRGMNWFLPPGLLSS